MKKAIWIVLALATANPAFAQGRDRNAEPAPPEKPELQASTPAPAPLPGALWSEVAARRLHADRIIPTQVFQTNLFSLGLLPGAEYRGRFACEDDDTEPLAAIVKRMSGVVKGVHRSRDLGNCPPNDLYPMAYARQAMEFAETSDRLNVSVITYEEALERGMGGLVAVGIVAGAYFLLT